MSLTQISMNNSLMNFNSKAVNVPKTVQDMPQGMHGVSAKVYVMAIVLTVLVLTKVPHWQWQVYERVSSVS
jgi:hypothetical protein